MRRSGGVRFTLWNYHRSPASGRSKDALIPDEIEPGSRDQSRELFDQLQRLQDDVARAVAPGAQANWVLAPPISRPAMNPVFTISPGWIRGQVRELELDYSIRRMIEARGNKLALPIAARSSLSLTPRLGAVTVAQQNYGYYLRHGEGRESRRWSEDH
jgi:hypothetical protein